MSVNLFSDQDFDYFIQLITSAGELALSLQKSGIEIQRKKDATIVTEADLKVQDFLISDISNNYPDFKFIHEENFNRAKSSITEDNVSVIIDPIDGTAMFSMHLPIWCVSIGIFRVFEPLYGFVYSPGSYMIFHKDKSW